MKAWTLPTPAPVETNPLKLSEIPVPEPGDGQVLVRVTACGICRTDLHVVEGELPPRQPNIVPGHQIVGVIERSGRNAQRYARGVRVGIPWLHKTCGLCAYCKSGRENLCDNPTFTGYSVNGGFAEYALADENFVYPIPEGFDDLQAAPLLCAGIIGFRCLRIAGIERGAGIEPAGIEPAGIERANLGGANLGGVNLGIYGFGAAGHVCLQVARYWGAKVFVCTREEKHRRLAAELGAVWVGGTIDPPPEKLDASIIFAPAGELVPPALAALKKGGTLVLGGIHMSSIPSFPYPLIYHERSIRSVANNTRQDGHDFLRLAAEIPVKTEIQIFPLTQVNEALNALKHDGIRGAGVIRP